MPGSGYRPLGRSAMSCEPAILFSFQDVPLLKTLGLYRVDA